ncbi:MAG: phosphatase PAP2 family protein [Deltaproteobacteria bacterium]|nr:phosphatase PAP2 family protein [Deltaproteobacteria bacterium]
MHESIADTRWLALFSVLTVLGSGWGSLLVLPLFASPRTRRFAAFLAGVIVTNAIVIALLKVLVRRPRPFLVLSGVHPLVFEAPGGWSFPSGHAAGSFSFAMFAALVLLRGPDYARHPAKRATLACFLLVAAAGVAASRVALGVHFPSDILVGALVGGAVGAVGARRYLATVMPAPSVPTSPSSDGT